MIKLSRNVHRFHLYASRRRMENVEKKMRKSAPGAMIVADDGKRDDANAVTHARWRHRQ